MAGPKEQPLPPDVMGREDATEVLRAFVVDGGLSIGRSVRKSITSASMPSLASSSAALSAKVMPFDHEMMVT